MYKDLDKKRKYEREYGARYRAAKLEQSRAKQTEIRRKIAAAIIVAELNQESNG